MYMWISRLMAVVFLLNVLSPAYAQVPAAPRRSVGTEHPAVTEARQQAEIARKVVDSFEASHQQYLESVVPVQNTAHNDFLNSSTFAAMSESYKRLDQLRNEGSRRLRDYQSQIRNAENDALHASGNVMFEHYRQNPHVAPDAISQTLGYDARFGSNPKDWLVRADEYSSKFAGYGCPSAADFLENLKNNQFEAPEELLEYIDPLGFNCANFLAIAYAAETLYYMLEEFTRPDSISEEEREEMTVFFSHVRYRAVASLGHLNESKFNDDETLYMARGTVRILLAQLEHAAAANHLQLLEKQLYVLTPTRKLWQTQYPKPTKAMQAEGAKYVGPSYKDFVKNNTRVVEKLSPKLESARAKGNVTIKAVTYSDYRKNPAIQGVFPEEAFPSLREGIPCDLGTEFYNELKDLKSNASGEESKEFTLLQLVVQYAAQFAVLTGDEKLLKDILALFEDKPGSDMKTTYSEVLAALFNSIYETLRNFNVSDHYVPAIMFLLDAAKDTHATNTRVLALAVLGRLTEKTDSIENTPMRADFSVTEEGEVVNKYWLSYEDRFDLAKSVATLYEPLQNTTSGMKDYGLNSGEMLSLSNELAGIYMQFLPMEAPTVTLGRCGRIEKVDTENRTTITVATLQQTKQGTIFDGDCPFQYTNGGIFVFGGRTGIVEMTALNYRNSRKYTAEVTNIGMELFGEALMWVFGGALIGGAFCGLRLLAGVAKSLPRAIRSGKLVYKATAGTRIYRFTAGAKRAQASMKVGSKYMSSFNFNAHLAKNGMAYTTATDAASPGLVKTSTAVQHGGDAARISSPSTRVTITAADASSGLAYQGTFGVSPDIGCWSTPIQRAQFLRFAQQRGLRNVWSAADREMFQSNIMWRNAFNKLWDPKSAQLSYYPGAIISEHPWVNAGLSAYGKTLRFFAWWQAGDIFTGIVYRDKFNNWMMEKQEAAVTAEEAKYGESLSEKALADVNAQNSDASESQPGDVLTRVGGISKEPFSWMDVLNFPSYVWQRIAPTEMNMTDGSLILPPFMFVRAGLAEAGVTSNPFITDAVKQQMAISAHRMDLSRAQIAKANHLSSTATENYINDLAQVRESLQQNIAVFKADFPEANWAEDEQALMTVLDDYEQALRSAEKITNIGERTKQKAAVVQQYEKQFQAKYTQIESKYTQLCDRQFNTTVEEQITLLEQSWYNDSLSLKEVGLDLSHPEIYERLDGIYQEAISELKKLQNPSVPSQVKVDKLNRCIQKIVSEREKILDEANNLLWSEQERSELYPDETTQVSSQTY